MTDEFTFPVPKTSVSESTVRNVETGEERAVTSTTSKQGDATGSGRAKVRLAPGYSQISWMTRSQNNRRLGIGDYKFNKNMTKEEVAEHNTVEDGWIIIRQKVYNMTPYLDYHPGGVDILKPVLGKDATYLFNKYHPWVNVDALMHACWMGIIEE